MHQQPTAGSNIQLPQQQPSSTDGNVNVGQLSIDQLKQILLQTLPTAVNNQPKNDATVEQPAPQVKSRQPHTQHTQIIVSTTQPVKSQTSTPQLINKHGNISLAAGSVILVRN